MLKRKDFASWLQGTDALQNKNYPGSRLQLPQTGSGSIARIGKRLLAIFIDWTVALLISILIFQNNALVTLTIFALEQTLLVGTLGFSIGHRLVGIKVLALEGKPVGFIKAIIRASLICLVIPAMVWDMDQRGLHDKIAKTILVKK